MKVYYCLHWDCYGNLLEESNKTTTPLFYVAGMVNKSMYVPGHRMSYILGAGDNTTDPDDYRFYNGKEEKLLILFYSVCSQ